MMCPEVDTKQHKKARFFMKTSYFFGENNLKSFFRPGWKGGCTHHRDPGAGEVQTRVCAKPFRECREVYPLYQGHFYAQFLHLIQRKEAFL